MKHIKEELLETIFNNLEDAVYILDANGRILLANNATIKMYDCPRSVFDELYTDTYEKLKNGTNEKSIYLQVLETKEEMATWLKVYDINKKPTLYYAWARPIFDSEGNVKYAVGSCRSQNNMEKNYIESQHKLGDYNSAHLTSAGSRLPLIYQSEAMAAVVKYLDNITNTNVSLLIQGETGTGKEVLAHYVHENSKRNDKDMVSVNCAALSPSLFESEMFGYSKGSFTGANAKGNTGLIEAADKSTLFLDEIDSIPIEQQGKLLRALETKSIRRVGSNHPVAVDFRLISATNKHLSDNIHAGLFREDLYYRLNVVSVTIPPLRERPEDIRPLAEYYLRKYSALYGREKCFSESVYDQLEQYQWPGNVRELKNVMEQTVLTSDINVHEIRSIHIPRDRSKSTRHQSLHLDAIAQEPNLHQGHEPTSPPDDSANALSLDDRLETYEKELIHNALLQYGSAAEAAKHLGISPPTLSRRIAKYKLNRYK